MLIIWIECPPGHKIMFSDGVRRTWHSSAGSIESFTERERARFERMCHLLDLFDIRYKTNEVLSKSVTALPAKAGNYSDDA